MSDLSFHWLLLIVHVSLKATALVAATAAFLWVLRIKNRNVEHALWVGVLAGMLALPLLTLSLPEIVLPLPSRLQGFLAADGASDRSIQHEERAALTSIAARRPVERKNVRTERRASSAGTDRAVKLPDDEMQAGDRSGDPIVPIAVTSDADVGPAAAPRLRESAGHDSAFSTALPGILRRCSFFVLSVWAAGAILLVVRLLIGLLIARRLVRGFNAVRDI